MNSNPLLGFGLAVLGGAFAGSFMVPMKKMPRWVWENSWSMYALTAYFILPWIYAFFLISDVFGIYSAAGWSIFILVFVFGIGWGVGALTLGLGSARVGMALGFAIILGLTAAVGSVVPLIIQHPERLASRESIAIYIGVVVIFIGLGVCAKAGMMKEAKVSAAGASTAASRSQFLTGLVFCLISGFLSPLMNFGLAFGEKITTKALELGASNSTATFPLWAAFLTGGFIVNAIYCIYLLNKNKTWGNFKQVGGGYWFGGFLMGFLWNSSLAIYGFGALLLGVLGASLGWPVFMTGIIVCANICGLLTGEWKGAGNKAVTTLITGIVILCSAIFIIGYGGAQ